jgi:hypothetical protein
MKSDYDVEWNVTEYHASLWNGVQQGARKGTNHDKYGMKVLIMELMKEQRLA